MLHTFSIAQDQEVFLIRHPQFVAGVRVGNAVYRMLYASHPQVTDADLLNVQCLLIPFETDAPLSAGLLFGWVQAFSDLHGRATLLADVEFTSGFWYGSDFPPSLETLDSDLELTSFLHDFLNGKTALSQEMGTAGARIGYVCATVAGLLCSREVIERLDSPALPVEVVFPAGQEVA